MKKKNICAVLTRLAGKSRTSSDATAVCRRARRTKGCFAGIMTFVVLLSCVMPVLATTGNVSYNGNAGRFIFAPGSSYSPTDLFSNFKDVMPGDSITQPIVVKNDSSNQVKVKIYMRSLGSHTETVDFLSKLHLRVEKAQDNVMAYMFDAAANETAQLTQWVCLGTLYSGGEVNLNVILDVPVDLDNTYQRRIGMLDWEFMIEEFAVEESDPEPPKTGDDFIAWFWIGIMVMCLVAILILLQAWKQGDRRD